MTPYTEWRDIKNAPYQKVIWVKNSTMREPVLATRGFTTELGVHPDNTFCTSVFTPNELFGFPAGNLVCATHWKKYTPPPQPGDTP